MAELLTAAGIVFILALGGWYLGSLLLRIAAFWCYVGAGLLLVLAGQGDVSPWAGPALVGWGTVCWTLGQFLYRLRWGWWRSPLAARLFSRRLPRRHPRKRRAEVIHGGTRRR
jgi:hypothetical protein